MKQFEFDKTALSQYIDEFILRAELIRQLRRKSQRPIDDGINFVVENPIKFLKSITARGSIGRELVNAVIMQQPQIN